MSHSDLHSNTNLSFRGIFVTRAKILFHKHSEDENWQARKDKTQCVCAQNLFFFLFSDCYGDQTVQGMWE